MLPANHRVRRILILTADAGLGHRRAAQALEVAFHELYGADCDCTLLNPADYGAMARLVRVSQRQYDRTARQHRRIYKATYQASNLPFIRTAVRAAMTPLLRSALNEVMREVDPDAIVSTFHLYLAPLAAILAERGSHVPFFAVVTDLADVHRLWFHPNAAGIFVSSEQMRSDAIAQGVAAERVVVSGVPVDPRLLRDGRPKPELKAALGWDPDLPVVLAVASPRARNMAKSIRALNDLTHPSQLVVVAGGDEALYDRLHTMDWRIPVHFFDWVEDLPCLMQAADVLVTKAGGLILTEALACGLPMILVDAIPGQETGNVAFVLDHQAGVLAANPDSLLRTLEGWLGDGEEARALAARHACMLGHRDAANRVAQVVWEAARPLRTPRAGVSAV